jgi:hypothetical protein
MKACICQSELPSGKFNDLIDHRYFYRDNGRGNYTCGLVRKAVGDQLLGQNINFADTGFLSSLARFIDNLSVVRFMIEYTVLSSIRLHGLSIGLGIETAMELRVLRKPLEFNDDSTDSPVLYRPQNSNFPAIDGIILFIKDGEIKKEKKKLLICPLQITVALNTHKDSREQFFKEHGQWVRDISKFDVEVHFLWITPTYRGIKTYPAGPEWPQHQERYIPLKEVNTKIGEAYEDAMRKRPEKRAAKSKPPKKRAAKGEPSKKTAAEGKPPTRRSDRLKK